MKLSSFQDIDVHKLKGTALDFHQYRPYSVYTVRELYAEN